MSRDGAPKPGKYVLVSCDGHQAVYENGHLQYDASNAERLLLEQLGVRVVVLDDHEIEGEFPHELMEIPGER